MRFRYTNTGLLAASLTAAGFAQSRQIPAPPQTQPVVIHSAVVHTVADGTIDDGYVVFEDGVITEVGSGAPPDVDGATRLNAGGMHVYPGLIASDTSLGLEETGAVDVTRDHTEYGSVRPEVRAAVAINPDSDHIPVTRANGILTAMVLPQGGLVSGRASLVRLDGWTWEDMTIDAEAGLVVSWPTVEPVSRPWMRTSIAQQQKEIRENLDEIDRLFDEAEAYVAARDHDPTVAPDLRYEAMRPGLAGGKPIFVRAARASQIESAVAWAQRRGYAIVIVGSTEADRVLPLLTKHDIPVVVPGVHRMPSARHGDYDEPFRLPLKLHEAGVRFAIAAGSGGSAHERNLNHQAATAAAYGLPKDAALRAVTLGPAQIFGVADRLGSIEPGKAATLIVTSGDPLEITTDTLVAFIDGRRIDLGNRQKTLYAKYREKYRQLGLAGN
jgi:imidazolonepropionase-like amidohydrolase